MTDADRLEELTTLVVLVAGWEELLSGPDENG
jgi:hypothetical protein